MKRPNPINYIIPTGDDLDHEEYEREKDKYIDHLEYQNEEMHDHILQLTTQLQTMEESELKTNKK